MRFFFGGGWASPGAARLVFACGALHPLNRFVRHGLRLPVAQQAPSLVLDGVTITDELTLELVQAHAASGSSLPRELLSECPTARAILSRLMSAPSAARPTAALSLSKLLEELGHLSTGWGRFRMARDPSQYKRVKTAYRPISALGRAPSNPYGFALVSARPQCRALRRVFRAPRVAWPRADQARTGHCV